MVCLIAFVLSALATACWGPPAWAEWLPPVNISEAGEYGGNPRVVLDAAGNATAVWQLGSGSGSAVAIDYRPAGGVWQAPTQVLPGEGPAIAVDGAGDTTVIWDRYAGTNKILIQAIYRPAGGDWQSIVDLGETRSMVHPEPWVASDEAGDTTAVWKSGEVIESSYRPAGGSWEQPVALSAEESFVPQAAMDSKGDAIVAWMHHDGSRYVVEGIYRKAGEGWEPRAVLSEEGEEGGDPEIAIADDGESIVVWDGSREEKQVARAVYRPAGEGWQAPVDVSGVGAEQQTLRVALDPNGDAMLVWTQDSSQVGAYGIVQASYRPAGAAWGPPTDLSEDGQNAFPCDVAFDKQGNAAVLWQRSNGTHDVVQGDYKPAGEDWQSPTNLSSPQADAYDAVLVLDSAGSSAAADGDATAVWTSSEGGVRIQAAGYDAIEPSEPLEAPAEGEVGEPIEVSAPTTDVWSPSLDFGDGTATGTTSASHIYSAPGIYTLTFASREVLGYSRTTLRTIAIEPASGSPLPSGEENASSSKGESDAQPPSEEHESQPVSEGGPLALVQSSSEPGGPATQLRRPGTKASLRLKATITAVKQTLRELLRSGELRFKCRLSAPGSCHVRTKLGGGEIALKHAGEQTLTIRLDRRALRVLHHRHVLRLAFVATAVGHTRVRAAGVLVAR